MSSKNELVVKTNWLNQALQNLSMIEIRIIQLAIIDARESGLGLSADKPLRIHSKRYAEAFDVQAKNAYANIKQAEDTLFKRQFTAIDKDGKPFKSRWVQDVKYLDEQGAIELCFTRKVVEGISRIDGAVNFFSKYLLSNTIKFNSLYSVRLYELLNQWRNADMRKMPMFELETIRGQLGIEPKQYSAIKDFKKRVLDYAVSEINEHSDLTVSYEQQKSGRKIIGFYFNIKIKTNEKAQKNKERDVNTVDMFDNLTDVEREIVNQKNAYADSINATPAHRQNLVNKALEQHRQAENDAKIKREQQAQAKKDAKAKADAELAHALEVYEQLLNADDAIIENFIIANQKFLGNGGEKFYFERKDYRQVLHIMKYKFETLSTFKSFDLSMI